VRNTTDAVARRSCGQLVAFLAARTTEVAADEVAADARLAEYQPYRAARAELLAKAAANTEARQAYEIAIGLDRDPVGRRFLQQRQSALTP